MTIHHYLMQACKDDAQRAGERDRVLLEARRARRARRQRPEPATPARRLARLLFGRATAALRSFQAPPQQAGQGHVRAPLSRQ